ncbi:MAG: GNAT family N-acetyltransferase [Candidatus Hodarchaeota archaeon]
MNSIQTKRLIFKRLSIEDSPDLFRTFGDPDVIKYWIGGAHKDIEETRQRIKELETHWEQYGFGDWGIVRKDDYQIIGFGGLHYIPDMTQVNVGYALEKSVWRQGFGTEACQYFLNYGFQILGLSKNVATIWPANTASINLAKKCGLQYWKQIIWSGSDRVIYTISNK